MKKEYAISFEETEIEPVAKLLKITKKEFMDKYIEMSVNGYEVKGKPCCFLTENGTCEIEKCKPEECREYPFTNKPERLFSLFSIVDLLGRLNEFEKNEFISKNIDTQLALDNMGEGDGAVIIGLN